MYLWNKKYKTKQNGYTICHTHNHACICSIYKAALTTKQKQQRQLTLYIQLVINMSKTILIGRPNTKILWWIKDLILVILNYLCHFDWLQVLRDEIWKWNDYRCNELFAISLRPKLTNLFCFYKQKIKNLFTEENEMIKVSWLSSFLRV